MENFQGPDCSEPKCPEGLSGPDCSFMACRRDCNDKGRCVKGQCVCEKGHEGADCSIPEICIAPCREICVQDLESPECETCKGQCLTLDLDPILGRHDPLRERVLTLQERAVAHEHREAGR